MHKEYTVAWVLNRSCVYIFRKCSNPITLTGKYQEVSISHWTKKTKSYKNSTGSCCICMALRAQKEADITSYRKLQTFADSLVSRLTTSFWGWHYQVTLIDTEPHRSQSVCIDMVVWVNFGPRMASISYLLSCQLITSLYRSALLRGVNTKECGIARVDRMINFCSQY